MDIGNVLKTYLHNLKQVFSSVLLVRCFFIHNGSVNVLKVGKKAKIRNRYNQVQSLTKDTVWRNDKYTRTYHILESQKISPFPAGDHKAA